MDKHLEVFKSLLIKLNGTNLVLAGTMALKAHGLMMNKNPKDLDIVIFKPTRAQLQILENLQLVALNKEAIDYPIESTKVLKFRKDDLYIDILLEDKETPKDLLFKLHGGYYYQVQDITYNMIAKNSFRTKDGQRRLKDVEDTLDLKNSNFNI